MSTNEETLNESNQKSLQRKATGGRVRCHSSRILRKGAREASLGHLPTASGHRATQTPSNNVVTNQRATDRGDLCRNAPTLSRHHSIASDDGISAKTWNNDIKPSIVMIIDNHHRSIDENQWNKLLTRMSTRATCTTWPCLLEINSDKSLFTSSDAGMSVSGRFGKILVHSSASFTERVPNLWIIKYDNVFNNLLIKIQLRKIRKWYIEKSLRRLIQNVDTKKKRDQI